MYYGSRNSSAGTRMTRRAKAIWGRPTSVAFRTCVVALRRIALLLLVATTSLAQEAPAAPAVAITGVVKAGNTPIQGAPVSGTNRSAQEKATTSTDTHGVSTLQVA